MVGILTVHSMFADWILMQVHDSYDGERMEPTFVLCALAVIGEGIV